MMSAASAAVRISKPRILSSSAVISRMSRLSSTTRIFGRSVGMSGPLRGERETEGRAAADRARGPDAAAVALHDAVHHRETDARPLELGVVVQPLERAEEPTRLGRFEPRAVVADEEDGVGRPLFFPTELDAGALRLPGELPC